MLYFWNANTNCLSYFVLSDQNFPKNAEFSVQEIIRVFKERFGDQNVESLLVWSYGSTKEFMNATMAGNMGSVAQDLDVIIIWNFFANNHGKNLCDSEFARLKTKLDKCL